MNKEKEFILCAAVYYNDGKKYEHQPKNIENGFVITGRRHHNCYMTLFITMGERVDKKLCQSQGFITSKDRYVDRKEAYKIAKEQGQLLFDPKREEVMGMLSEDIY